MFTQITNEQFSAVQKVGIDFTIDEGIGLNTTVTVTAKQISNIEIKLTGSNNFLLLEPATQTKVQSLIVSGILEVCISSSFFFFFFLYKVHSVYLYVYCHFQNTGKIWAK